MAQNKHLYFAYLISIFLLINTNADDNIETKEKLNKFEFTSTSNLKSLIKNINMEKIV